MNETKKLVDSIVIACQNKKAKDIVTIDIRKVPGSICEYFVVCQGGSPTQVHAIAGEIENYVRINCDDRPIRTEGLRDSDWVGIDYGTVIVHIFIPELREFYAFEQLWGDGEIVKIENID